MFLTIFIDKDRKELIMIVLEPDILRKQLIKIIEDNPDTLMNYTHSIGLPRPNTLHDFLHSKTKPTFLTMLRIKKFIKEWQKEK